MHIPITMPLVQTEMDNLILKYILMLQLCGKIIYRHNLGYIFLKGIIQIDQKQFQKLTKP